MMEKYGLLLLKRKQYNEAIEVLKRALYLCPEDIECYHALEEAYYETFHYKENEVITDMISLLTSKAWENNQKEQIMKREDYIYKRLLVDTPGLNDVVE